MRICSLPAQAAIKGVQPGTSMHTSGHDILSMYRKISDNMDTMQGQSSKLWRPLMQQNGSTVGVDRLSEAHRRCQFTRCLCCNERTLGLYGVVPGSIFLGMWRWWSF